MKFGYLTALTVIACLTSAGMAKADSSCWPEQKLLGSTATGFYFPYSERDIDVSRIPNGPLKIMSCGDIAAIGDCGEEHRFVPVWGRDKNTLRIRLSDGSTAYTKIAGDMDNYHDIIAINRTGHLFPDNTPIFTAAGTKAKSPKRDINRLNKFITTALPGNDKNFDDLLADREIGLTYQVRTIVRNTQGTWVKVDEKLFVFTGDGPEKKESGILRTGYFHYKDADGKILAVIEDEWCD